MWLGNEARPYLGISRFQDGRSEKTNADEFDRVGKYLSAELLCEGTLSSIAAYNQAIRNLCDEIIPGKRQPTHWIDSGYINSKISRLICIPVRLCLPGYSSQSSAIRISGYLQAVISEVPQPLFPIGSEFASRYTSVLLNSLLVGWAHERGKMTELRKILSI
jgi:hypothetical protein